MTSACAERMSSRATILCVRWCGCAPARAAEAQWDPGNLPAVRIRGLRRAPRFTRRAQRTLAKSWR